MAYLHCQTRIQIPIRVWISIPKIGTVVIRDSDPDHNLSLSLCNSNSFCAIQFSHQVFESKYESESVFSNVNKPEDLHKSTSNTKFNNLWQTNLHWLKLSDFILGNIFQVQIRLISFNLNRFRSIFCCWCHLFLEKWSPIRSWVEQRDNLHSSSSATSIESMLSCTMYKNWTTSTKDMNLAHKSSTCIS